MTAGPESRSGRTDREAPPARRRGRNLIRGRIASRTGPNRVVGGRPGPGGRMSPEPVKGGGPLRQAVGQDVVGLDRGRRRDVVVVAAVLVVQPDEQGVGPALARA